MGAGACTSYSPVPRCPVSLPRCHCKNPPIWCSRKAARRWGCRHHFPRSLVVARSASTDLVTFDHVWKLISPCLAIDNASVHVQSAGLLEAVATAALRSRLRRYDKVETSIDCNILGLLTGAVQRVDIHGTGWESRAGLTARLLDVICRACTYHLLPLLLLTCYSFPKTLTVNLWYWHLIFPASLIMYMLQSGGHDSALYAKCGTN